MNRNKKHAFKLRRLNIILWPGIISGVTLLAIGVLCLNPAPLENPAHATTYCMGPDGYVECDTSSSINTYARIAPVVSIGLQSDVVMDVTPKASGVFTEESVNVTVATNSSEGYSLYMRTLDDTNALTSIKKDDPTTIKAVEGEVETDALAAQGNVWGYKLNANSGETHDDLYRAVPATSSEQAIHVTDTKPITGTDSLDLTFGVHVDTSLPSGTYRNSVLVSAVANPVSITNLSELVFMQDMTSSICSNTAYDENGATTPEEADPLKPVTKQLIDTRDGKKYWVAKLKDGNCWMTQNLGLDLGPDITLTPADSDVTSNWSANKVTSYGDHPFTTQYQKSSDSYNPGEWVLKAVDGTKYCGRAEKVPNLNDPTCADVVQDVSGWKASADTDAEIYDTSTSTYNAHYLLGNYYTYGAAIADNDSLLGNFTKSETSICAKGWRLPGNFYNGGTTVELGNSDYYKLYRTYGWTAEPNYTMNWTAGAILPPSAPLYEMPAGRVDTLRVTDNNVLYGIGFTSYLWNADSGSDYGSNAAMTGFEVPFKKLWLYHNSWRGFAHSVRCLAR